MSFRDPTIPSGTRGDRRRGLVYPSPFFDVAQSYMPPTVKELLRWCAYFFYTDPLLGSAVYKIAEYPITDFIYNNEDENVRKKWKETLEDILNIKPFLIEIGLDFFTFGNAFISINLPFRRLIRCPECNHQEDIREVKYKFRSWEFHYVCSKCKEEVIGKTKDVPIKSAHDINFIRWDPKNIEIEYNPLTGKSRYRYRLPNKIRKSIMQGKPEVLNDIPWIFIEAAKSNKDIILSTKNLFHFKRPTLAEQDQGWGKPLIIHSMKRLFYLYVLRRAQEAIALQRILPLEFIFPQPNASQDPYCVSLDTPLLCKDGIKPASEVKKGDYLKSHTGAWKKVEAAVTRSIDQKEKVYKFTIAGMTAFPFEISEQHPILAVHRPDNWRGLDSIRNEPDWIYAEDIREKDFVCYPTRRPTWENYSVDLKDYCPDRAATEKYIYRRLNQESAEIYEYLEKNGAHEFERGERACFLSEKKWDIENYSNAKTAFLQQDSIDRIERRIPIKKELAYIIGMYAAQGCPNGKLTQLCLHSTRNNVIEKIDKCLKEYDFCPGTSTSDGDNARYSINDVFLSGLLKEACGKGAQNKRLPRFLVEAPRDIAIEAIRGVWEGDGCSFSSSGTERAGLKTTSPQLAVDVRTVLLSEGIIPVIQKNSPRENDIAKLDYYQVNCNGPQRKALQDLFYGEKVYGQSGCGFIRDGYVYLRVAKKEIVDVDRVRGFQIKGDKSFCVISAATHNSHVNLSQWSTRVQEEIRKWRTDPNYISCVPVPLGFERLGGDGRALMLGPEIEIANKEITGGMGIPLEFLFGGLSWSGSSVSLRTLENHFLMYRRLLMRFLNFVKGHLVIHLGLPDIDLKFTEFKMADDIQRKQLVMQLNAAQKISNKTLLTELGFDFEKEQKTIRQEVDKMMELQEIQMKAQAKAQGEAQIMSVKYQMQAQEAQMKAQQQMQEEQGYPQDQQGYSQEEGQPPQEQQQQQPAPEQAGAEREMAEQATAQTAQPQQQREKGQPAGGGRMIEFDVDSIAKRWATRLMRMDQGQRNSVLADLQARMPNMARVVMSLIGMTPAGGTAGEAGMKQLPEQKPPRRKESPV